MNKIKLYFQIKQFYNTFGEENPCAKWSDMTNDNINDVLFDINEALDSYGDTDEWLETLSRDIHDYCENKPSILLNITLAICTLFILWFTISTAEIVCKNSKPNPEYSSLNLWIMLFDKDEPVENTQYTAFGRYYTNGTVITEDGNEWGYTTDTISDQIPTDNMPVWVAFDDNGTPNKVEDDVILGLVYDRETAIYDDLEAALGDKFELTRDGNNIHIGGIK